MIINWKKLLHHLSIDERSVSNESINKLTKWIKENLSQEQSFSTNSLKDTFIKIKTYASKYFILLPYINKNDFITKQKDLQGFNAFQYAALNGFDKLIEKMLNSCEDKNQLLTSLTDAKLTALHLSAYEGKLCTSKILLENGASILARSKRKQTPLHMSLILPSLKKSNGDFYKNKVALSCLLKEKIPNSKIGLTDIEGNTIAHLASTHEILPILDDLLQSHPKMFLVKNNMGHTPLHNAILNRRYKSAKRLSVIPELLSTADNQRKLPIHYAAQNGDSNLLNLCLNSGNINAQDDYRRTPLHYAAWSGNLENVERLIAKGAELESQDSQDNNVLYYAKESSNKDLFNFLETKYALANHSVSNKV